MQPNSNFTRVPFDDGRPLTALDQYRLEMLEISPLSVPEEYRLAEMAKSGNQDAAWMILESVLPYVAYIARKRALVAGLDPLDLLQAGNEEMVARLENAIWSRYPVPYLKVVAKHAISRYCIEYGAPIRVPHMSFKRGKRAPAVVSLDAPLREEMTLLDLLAEVQ